MWGHNIVAIVAEAVFQISIEKFSKLIEALRLPIKGTEAVIIGKTRLDEVGVGRHKTVEGRHRLGLHRRKRLNNKNCYHK